MHPTSAACEYTKRTLSRMTRKCLGNALPKNTLGSFRELSSIAFFEVWPRRASQLFRVEPQLHEPLNDSEEDRCR